MSDRHSSSRPRGKPRRAALASLALVISGAVLSSCGRNNSNGDVPPVTIASEVAQAVTPIFVIPPTETPIPTPTPTIPPTPEFIDGVPTSPEQLAAANLLQGEPGVYGVAVLGPTGKLIVSHNAHLPFVTASTYKLILMADILKKVEAGELSVEQTYTLEQDLFEAGDGDMYFATTEAGTTATLEDLLFAAGAYSSNVAGLTMLTLTTPESLRQTAEQIGMNETWLLSEPGSLPNWPPMAAPDTTQADADAARAYIEESAQLGPVNISTPFDMATYMQKLSTNTLVSPFVSEQILKILEGQMIRDRLPYLQADDVKVIDKPGNLEDVVNDVGILYLPNGEVRTAALLTLDVPDDDHATQVEQRLALPPYYANAAGTPTP